MTGQLPRFQFGLRKALLWMVVWALFLGIMRVAWSPAAVIAALYAVVLLGIRIKWGFDPGFVIAVLLTSFLPIAITAVQSCLWVYSGVRFGDGAVLLAVFLLFWVFVGFPIGYWSFMFVHGVVKAVDWLDSLLQAKTENQP